MKIGKTSEDKCLQSWSWTLVRVSEDDILVSKISSDVTSRVVHDEAPGMGQDREDGGTWYTCVFMQYRKKKLEKRIC